MAKTHLCVESTLSTRKKAQQRLYFLRQLKKFKVNQTLLVPFYRSVIESVLTFSCTLWFCSTTKEKDELQHVVKTTSKIIGCDLHSLDKIFIDRSISKSKAITKDMSHPAHNLFATLPSGKSLRSLKARTMRFRNSFYPTAIRIFNENKLVFVE